MKLDNAVIGAMCAPWGAQRQQSVLDLAQAIEEMKEVNHESIEDLAIDLVMDVSPKNCIQAGFENPGPKIERKHRAVPPVPPEFMLSREGKEPIPPPPPGFSISQNTSD